MWARTSPRQLRHTAAPCATRRTTRSCGPTARQHTCGQVRGACSVWQSGGLPCPGSHAQPESPACCRVRVCRSRPATARSFSITLAVQQPRRQPTAGPGGCPDLSCAGPHICQGLVPGGGSACSAQAVVGVHAHACVRPCKHACLHAPSCLVAAVVSTRLRLADGWGWVLGPCLALGLWLGSPLDQLGSTTSINPPVCASCDDLLCAGRTPPQRSSRAATCHQATRSLRQLSTMPSQKAGKST